MTLSFGNGFMNDEGVANMSKYVNTEELKIRRGK